MLLVFTYYLDFPCRLRFNRINPDRGRYLVFWPKVLLSLFFSLSCCPWKAVYTFFLPSRAQVTPPHMTLKLRVYALCSFLIKIQERKINYWRAVLIRHADVVQCIAKQKNTHIQYIQEVPSFILQQKVTVHAQKPFKIVTCRAARSPCSYLYINTCCYNVQ